MWTVLSAWSSWGPLDLESSVWDVAGGLLGAGWGREGGGDPAPQEYKTAITTVSFSSSKQDGLEGCWVDWKCSCAYLHNCTMVCCTIEQRDIVFAAKVSVTESQDVCGDAGNLLQNSTGNWWKSSCVLYPLNQSKTMEFSCVVKHTAFAIDFKFPPHGAWQQKAPPDTSSCHTRLTRNTADRTRILVYFWVFSNFPGVKQKKLGEIKARHHVSEGQKNTKPWPFTPVKWWRSAHEGQCARRKSETLTQPAKNQIPPPGRWWLDGFLEKGDA